MKKNKSIIKWLLNTSQSVSYQLSSAKGIFLFSFIFLDIFFSIFQLLPYMGILFFGTVYFIPYFLTFIMFIWVSLKNPGFKKKLSGENLLKLLSTQKSKHKDSYESFGEMEKLHNKICYHCNDTIGKDRHCETCNKCVKRCDHHCPFVLNCIGERNIKLFNLFLISGLVFGLLKLTLNIMGMANKLCWNNYYETENNSYSQNWNLLRNPQNYPDSFERFKSSSRCEYDYTIFGKLGDILRIQFSEEKWGYYLMLSLNIVHIILNAGIVLLVMMLLRYSLVNWYTNVTTYERYLHRKMMKGSVNTQALQEQLIIKGEKGKL